MYINRHNVYYMSFSSCISPTLKYNLYIVFTKIVDYFRNISSSSSLNYFRNTL